MRLVPLTPKLCTLCSEPLVRCPGGMKCANPDCALSAFSPDPAFGSEPDTDEDESL